MGKSLTVKDACKKCGLREDCAKFGGCGLLKFYLDKAEDTLSSRFEDEKHNQWDGDFHEIPLSFFGGEDRPDASDYLEKLDGEKVKEYFSDIGYEHLPKQVQIFYDYLFRGFTYLDLSIKFDCSPQACKAMVYQVADNLKNAIHVTTRKLLYIRKRKGLSLPKSIQYLLAYYLDDLSLEQIGNEFGVSCNAVNSALIKTRGLLENGQIVLALEKDELVLKRLRKPGSNKAREEQEYLRKKIA